MRPYRSASVFIEIHVDINSDAVLVMTQTNRPASRAASPFPSLWRAAHQCWPEAKTLLAKRGYRIEFGHVEDGELVGLFWFTWENPSEPTWDIEAGESFTNEDEAWLNALRHYFETTRFLSAEDANETDDEDADAEPNG